MLDDLKYIHEKDAQDALGIAEKQWQQLQHFFEMPELNFSIDNIVVAGMGGSALAALLSASWPDYNVPFEICRDYAIPSYVNDKTLFVASSYSGNTEETIEAIGRAKERNAKIVVVASGGRLADIAREEGYPFAELPAGYQPRHAVLYAYKAIITILERAGLVLSYDAAKNVYEAGGYIQEAVAGWRPDVRTAENEAKQLALELSGKSPVIYAGPLLFPAAYKWKISFNENAKNVAWCNQFPEFNHNEFLGWISHPVDKPYGIIELHSNLEHERVQKRFSVTNKLLSGRWPQPLIIEAKGETVLQQVLYTVALGDFVSIYLALLNGLNPTPVDLIEKFKAELSA